MRSATQVTELDGLVDFIGFIFYKSSKRYVETTPPIQNTRKVGVFVNASIEEVESGIQDHQLDCVQLHGNESPEMCSKLKKQVQVIKAFGVDSTFDFSQTNSYSDHVDFFLFDTKTVLYGGSGKRFNWSILSKYEGVVPFFLSGGINLASIDYLENIHHPKLAGVDLNSGFEHAPADKNISELKQFIKELKQ